MGFFLITIFVIFSLGLMDFIDRSEWEELDERNASRLSSNKAYGAYKMRTTQPLTLLAIVGGAVLILLVYFTGNAIASVNGYNADNVAEKSSQYVDTTQFTMNIDQQEKEVPPGAFNQSGNNGDNMPQAQRGAEEKGEPREIKDRPTANRPEKPKNMTQEEYERALEQSFFDEFKDNEAKREKMKADNEKAKKEREEKNKAKQKQVEGGDGGTSGSNASAIGQASVTWKFSDNRDAYGGDPGRVPVPAYTCGNSADAKVVVKVVVDGAGKVLNATIQSTTLENGCIKNNALQYARKSRFEPSSMAEQTGTITYIYKAQK